MIVKQNRVAINLRTMHKIVKELQMLRHFSELVVVVSVEQQIRIILANASIIIRMVQCNNSNSLRWSNSYKIN